MNDNIIELEKSDEFTKFASEFTIDDIPDSMRIIAERCCVVDAVLLMYRCPGIPLYIPGSGKRDIIRYYIKKNYDGRNTLSIAVKLGIDSSKVQEVVNTIDENEKLEPVKMPNEYMVQVAEECGIDTAMRLMEAFPSSKYYIPHNGRTALQKIYIQRHFNGSNVIRLAVKLRVSEMFVRKAISEMYRKKQNQATTVLHEVKRIIHQYGHITQLQIDRLVSSDKDRSEVEMYLQREKINVQLKLL